MVSIEGILMVLWLVMCPSVGNCDDASCLVAWLLTMLVVVVRSELLMG